MVLPANQEGGFEDQYNVPMYFTAETARLVNISRYRVRRWLEGYEYSCIAGRRRQQPVVRKGWQDKDYPHYASFLDLVDLLFVKRFLDYGISLQKLRKALDEAKEILGTNHFARQSFFTDGKNICLKVKNKGNAILELLSDGQWVISDIIKQLAHQIDFDESSELARRWRPVEGNGLVVLDPMISFGRPIIVDKGITTENISDLFFAEREKMGPVCDWMELTSKEVEAAVKFERHLTA